MERIIFRLVFRELKRGLDKKKRPHHHGRQDSKRVYRLENGHSTKTWSVH